MFQYTRNVGSDASYFHMRPNRTAQTMDQNSIRSQLAPGWTPLNILIMVALFVFVWWPFGLLMLAYILFGANLGLNLAEPATFKEAFARLTGGSSVSSGSTAQWKGDRADTGSPAVVSSNTNDLRDEAERLRQERENLDRERADLNHDRENLDRERAEFEAEKKAFEQQRHEDA